jgi:hypothetical protein
MTLPTAIVLSTAMVCATVLVIVAAAVWVDRRSRTR